MCFCSGGGFRQAKGFKKKKTNGCCGLKIFKNEGMLNLYPWQFTARLLLKGITFKAGHSFIAGKRILLECCLLGSRVILLTNSLSPAHGVLDFLENRKLIT